MVQLPFIGVGLPFIVDCRPLVDFMLGVFVPGRTVSSNLVVRFHE